MLISNGYIDSYRLLHPNHIAQPGYTHFVDSTIRQTKSRIDFIWTSGISPSSHQAIHIDHSLHTISHHRLLWLELSIDDLSSLDASIELPSLRLPNLRSATEVHQHKFIQHLHHQLEYHDHELQTHADTLTSDSLNSLALHLTQYTHDAAFKKLPLTGSNSHRTKSILSLQRQRRTLTRLLHMTHTILELHLLPIHTHQWKHLYQLCQSQYHIYWSNDLERHHSINDWLEETKSFITQTRATIRRERKRLDHQRESPFDANPTA